MVKRIQVFVYVLGSYIVEKENSRVKRKLVGGGGIDHLFGENKLKQGFGV